MKKLLSLLPLLAIIGCSPERVHIDDIQENKEAKMLFDQGKPFTGITYDVYSNGQLSFELEIKDGKRNGLYQAWYENGQWHLKGTYKDAKLDGLLQEWYENGQLLLQATFKDDELNGLYQEWDENGTLIEQSNWKDGVEID